MVIKKKYKINQHNGIIWIKRQRILGKNKKLWRAGSGSFLKQDSGLGKLIKPWSQKPSPGSNKHETWNPKQLFERPEIFQQGPCLIFRDVLIGHRQVVELGQ